LLGDLFDAVSNKRAPLLSDHSGTKYLGAMRRLHKNISHACEHGCFVSPTDVLFRYRFGGVGAKIMSTTTNEKVRVHPASPT
jgi:hypothetical protein